MKYNALFAAMVLTAASSSRAHDPGLSALELCPAAGNLEIRWSRHGPPGSTDLTLLMADRVVEAKSFQVEEATSDDHTGVWVFPKAAAEFSVQLHNFKALGFGHRVLATQCDSAHRAVLSASAPSWTPVAWQRSESDRAMH